ASVVREDAVRAHEAMSHRSRGRWPFSRARVPTRAIKEPMIASTVPTPLPVCHFRPNPTSAVIHPPRLIFRSSVHRDDPSPGYLGAPYRVDVDHLRTTIGQQRREGRLSSADSPAETDNHHDQATYATRTQVRQYGSSLGEGSIGVRMNVGRRTQPLVARTVVL